MKFIKLKPAILDNIEEQLGSDCLVIHPSANIGFAMLRREVGSLKAYLTFLKMFVRVNKDSEMYKLVDKNMTRKIIRNPMLRRIPLFLYLNRRNKIFKCYMIVKQIEDITGKHPELISLIHNGTMTNDSLLALVARRNGRSALFIENGYFPDTLQVDPQGINAENSLTRDPDFYRNLKFDKNQPVPKGIGTRISKVEYQVTDEIPQKYVFVPFQVPSDMQITELSPWVRNMEVFYDLLLHLVSKNPTVEFVIKEHPSYRHSIQKSVKVHPRIHFANGNPTPTLIKNSSAVLTINSTVGIESLVLEKKVITLGLAAYNIDGLVQYCQDKNELLEAVNSLDTWNFDEELREKFLKYLYYDFLVQGSFDTPQPYIGEQLLRKVG